METVRGSAPANERVAVRIFGVDLPKRPMRLTDAVIFLKVVFDVRPVKDRAAAARPLVINLGNVGVNVSVATRVLLTALVCAPVKERVATRLLRNALAKVPVKLSAAGARIFWVVLDVRPAKLKVALARLLVIDFCIPPAKLRTPDMFFETDLVWVPLKLRVATRIRGNILARLPAKLKAPEMVLEVVFDVRPAKLNAAEARTLVIDLGSEPTKESVAPRLLETCTL